MADHARRGVLKGTAAAGAFARIGPATVRRCQGDPQVRRHSGQSERAVRPAKLDWVRNEIARMRRAIRAQEREIQMLKRAATWSVGTAQPSDQ